MIELDRVQRLWLDWTDEADADGLSDFYGCVRWWHERCSFWQLPIVTVAFNKSAVIIITWGETKARLFLIFLAKLDKLSGNSPWRAM